MYCPILTDLALTSDDNITKGYEFISSPASRVRELDDHPTLMSASSGDESEGWEHVSNGSSNHSKPTSEERRPYSEVVKERDEEVLHNADEVDNGDSEIRV